MTVTTQWLIKIILPFLVISCGVLYSREINSYLTCRNLKFELFKMEEILQEVIDTKDFMKFEKKYKLEEAVGKVEDTTAFEYAWCLVRSKYKNDWRKGRDLLEKLYSTGDNHAKRDYIFYMAVAEYKLKNYEHAQKFCNAILTVEPQNKQAKELNEIVKKTIRKEAMIGAAVVGGAGLVVGAGIAALAAIGAIVASKRSWHSLEMYFNLLLWNAYVHKNDLQHTH